MRDDADAIDEYPFGGLESAHMPGLESHAFAEVLNFFSDGAHLSRGGAGGDDKEFGDRGAASEVEEDDFLGAGVGSHFGGGEGEAEGGRRIGDDGLLASGHGNPLEKTPRELTKQHNDNRTIWPAPNTHDPS